MSCRVVRPLLTSLALALVLVFATPAHASPRERPAPSSISTLLPGWMVSLLEKIGMQIDPNGAAAPDGGTSTSSDTGTNGDIGWHIDPNG